MNYNISVITPAYNAANFIECMVESVIRQDEKVELIIIDDGSKDNTGEKCTVLAQLYDNIVYVRTENMGAGHARNEGIRRATGEWIIFLDADDLLLPHSVNLELTSYLGKLSDVDIVYAAKSKTSMDLLKDIIVNLPEEFNEIKNHIPRLEFWTCIYRKKYLIDNAVYFFEYREQDIETAFRYRAFSRTKRIVVNKNIHFYLQRDNLGSNTHTFNYYNLYSIKAKVYYELFHELQKYVHNQGEESYLYNVAINMLFQYFRYVSKNGIISKDQIEQYDEMKRLSLKLKTVSVKNTEMVIKDKFTMVIKNFYVFWFIKTHPIEKLLKIETDNNTEIKNKADSYDRDLILSRWERISVKAL